MSDVRFCDKLFAVANISNLMIYVKDFLPVKLNCKKLPSYFYR